MNTKITKNGRDIVVAASILAGGMSFGIQNVYVQTRLKPKGRTSTTEHDIAKMKKVKARRKKKGYK